MRVGFVAEYVARLRYEHCSFAGMGFVVSRIALRFLSYVSDHDVVCRVLGAARVAHLETALLDRPGILRAIVREAMDFGELQ